MNSDGIVHAASFGLTSITFEQMAARKVFHKIAQRDDRNCSTALGRFQAASMS
jgi:hypothetical protein